MFYSNIMTFNPGWDDDASALEKFDDVRVLQNVMKERGVALSTEADADGDGPASVTLADPDGNQILIDQHVPSP